MSRSQFLDINRAGCAPPNGNAGASTWQRIFPLLSNVRRREKGELYNEVWISFLERKEMPDSVENVRRVEGDGPRFASVFDLRGSQHFVESLRVSYDGREVFDRPSGSSGQSRVRFRSGRIVESGTA